MTESVKVKELLELLQGWCDTLVVETPTEGLMKGKFVLFYTPAPGYRHGLVIAGNSYDEVALNSILGLLEHSRSAIARLNVA